MKINSYPQGLHGSFLGLLALSLFAVAAPAQCPPIQQPQTFDFVTPPALPGGWDPSQGINATGAPFWVTSPVRPSSQPNDAFSAAPDGILDNRLDASVHLSPFDFLISFANYYNLQSGRDGAVLEVSHPSVNGGAFTDIRDPAINGSVSPGYNSTISTAFQSPIAGRMAWSGNSGGYVGTFIDLHNLSLIPPVSTTIKLRFRMVSDNSESSEGWRVDSVAFIHTECGSPSPTPTATAPTTPTPTATATATAIATPCNGSPNLIADSTFEAGTPWPAWTVQTSTAFGTPLCNTAICGTGDGTAPPYSGTNWAWFGGTNTTETSTLGQSVVIPSGSQATLNFVMRIGKVSSPYTDVLDVKVDGTIVQSYPEPIEAETTYRLRTINLSAFADGASHLLSFQYTGPTSGISSYSVDNIILNIGPCAAPTPGPATHFAVVAPSGALQFISFNFTVTALDQFNNTATGYTGTIHFTTTSSGSTLPANSTLTNGTGTFSATLNSLGVQTITATDTVNSSITGTSNPIMVFQEGPTPTATATVPPSPPPTPTPSLTLTPTPTPICPLVNTQSTSETITSGNSVACNNGSGHTDNSYWRAFNIYIPSPSYIITSASFGIESVNTPQPVTVRLHVNTGAAFPAGTRTLIGTRTVTVTNAQSGTVVQVPFGIVGVPAGTAVELVMELFTPDGQTAGNLFLVGSNAAPQTGPSYVSAPACGVTTPTDLAALGFPNMHIVFKVEGFCEGTPPPPTPTATATATATPTATATATATPSSTPIVGEITLVSRLSDATAAATNSSMQDFPPPQVQTDFLPANLNNDATVSGESGAAAGISISNSSIILDNTKGTLQVTGDGIANSDAIVQNAAAAAGAKLIVLNFALPNFSYAYSLTGAIAGSGNGGYELATAKLTNGSGTTLFEVVAGVGAPPSVTLSETGILAPGTYTFSVELESHTQGSISGNSAHSSGNFLFALEAAPTPTTTPTPTPTTTPTPTPSSTPARPLNLSTRMLVQTDDQVGIGGFIITGTAPKHITVRGIGPSLGSFGVPNPLADPILELHGPSPFVTIINDNWRDTNTNCVFNGLGPPYDLESAICDVMLDPGAYTAVLKGKNNGAGVGLVEIYDEGPATSQLGNISTRAFVGAGGDVVIGGFILGGGTNTNVVIRGIGPSLAGFGIPNPLADPTLELRDNNGAILASNDDCPSSILPPTDPLEACINISLPAGTYTAILAGKNGGTGVGLVEIYNLNE